MNRNTLRKIHAAAGAGAFLFIASFWSSTVFSELFGSHETVAAVKQTIVYALFGLIACMATAGATGMKMGGKSKHAAIAAKRRRIALYRRQRNVDFAALRVFLKQPRRRRTV